MIYDHNIQKPLAFWFCHIRNGKMLCIWIKTIYQFPEVFSAPIRELHTRAHLLVLATSRLIRLRSYFPRAHKFRISDHFISKSSIYSTLAELSDLRNHSLCRVLRIVIFHPQHACNWQAALRMDACSSFITAVLNSENKPGECSCPN